MSLGMLTNNKIPGIAQTIYTQMDVERYIKFNISARISADNVFSGVVNRKRVLGIFNSIVTALMSAEDYMIDQNTAVLDMKYIFADVSTYEAVLIFIPVEQLGNKQLDVKDFFKTTIYNSRFDQTEDCEYVAKIINYLNSTPAFSLADFKNVLDSVSLSKEIPKAGPTESNMNVEAPKTVQPTVSTVKPVAKQEEVGAARNIPVPEKKEIKRVQTPAPVVEKLPQNDIAYIPPVPGKKKEERLPDAAAQKRNSQNEKEISLWYLLQHYNKDNAAEYKRQKEAKKAGKEASAKPEKVKKQKESSKKAAKSKPAEKMPGFAIPGQNDQEDKRAVQFDIPGRESQDIVPEVKRVSEPVAVRNEMKQEPVYMPPVQRPAANADFGDTNFFYDEVEDGTETVILNAAIAEQKARPYLIRQKNNEQILIDKPLFRIGRDYDFNDYAMVENKYVGHCHCHILTQDGEYFVVDDNSKNHTRLNGAVLSSGTQYKISHDNVICVADEEFQFKLF